MMSSNTSKNASKFQKIKNLVGSWCVRNISCWRYLLEAKYFWIVLTKELAVGALRIGAHSFFWCQGAKKKDLYSKCSLLFFENRFENRNGKQEFSKVLLLKITKYLKNEWKMSSTVPIFNFTPGVELVLKIDKILLRITFFQSFTSPKMIQ